MWQRGVTASDTTGCSYCTVTPWLLYQAGAHSQQVGAWTRWTDCLLPAESS